jgi:hypothetical protein
MIFDEKIHISAFTLRVTQGEKMKHLALNDVINKVLRLHRI